MLSRMSLNAVSKAVPKSQSFSNNKSLHILCQKRIIFVPNVSNCRKVEGSFIRHASTESFDSFQIPTPPITPIIDEPKLLIENVSELTIAGLGTSWTPVSLVQHSLDFLHTSVGLPWWGAIITVTVIGRLLWFPMFIRGQSKMAEVMKYLPEIQAIQKKLSEARSARDPELVEEYSKQLSISMKGRELDTLKCLAPSVMQGAIAISIFLSLDRMIKAPLKSMEEGGLFWFTNLCIADPHCILPLMSSTTLFLMLYCSSKMMPFPGSIKKFFIGVVPLIAFLCIKSFPAACLLYWVTTNSLTLLQTNILNLPAVRKYYNLGEIPHPKSTPANFSGVVKSFRENLNNVKVSQQYQERYSLQDLERVRRSINKSKFTSKYTPKNVEKITTSRIRKDKQL